MPFNTGECGAPTGSLRSLRWLLIAHQFQISTHAVNTWITRGLNQQIKNGLIEGWVTPGKLRDCILNTRSNPFTSQKRTCCQTVLGKERLNCGWLHATASGKAARYIVEKDTVLH